MKHLKEEFDKLTIKDVLVYSLAIVSIVAAFVLLFLGLFIPPEGEIHDSVLTAYGLTLLFVGSLLGISMRIESELNKFKSSITERVDALTRKEATA
ncbi:hypothetical protein [uncultured Duncaniella sp.]|uniref:hypothetical protein n=1 Tax=uncultured Duncaniella sp. TaxID=2768039 RepID=UPI0025F797A7|nr:hypothetical protein [uncultured Duncaniella sp.]